MTTRRATLVAILGVLLLGGAVATAQPPDPPGDPEEWIERARRVVDTIAGGGFVAYHELLDDRNLVVIARLKKFSASRKKRVRPEDAVFPGAVRRLGVGTDIARAVARGTGSNYYHATGKTTLTIDEVLFGKPPADRVKLQFPLQIEKTGGGETHHLILGESPTSVDKGVLAVWILQPQKKPRGTFKPLRVFCHREPKGTPPSVTAKFKRKQLDYHEVNARIRVLTDAAKVAQGFYESDKLKEAAAVLDAALKDQLKVKALDFEEEAKRLVRPYRRKVESMLKTLREKLDGKPAGSAPAPAEKKQPAGEKKAEESAESGAGG